MCKYVRGETYARKPTPTFEFKAASTGYTGGGYPRVRSKERRDHTPGEKADDVFVTIHRLAALVWCYDIDMPIEDVLADLAGKDVHHTLGMPSANLEGHLEVIGHGRHSEVTQAKRRAWAEDAKRQVEREQQTFDDESDVCESEGCRAEVSAAVGSRRLCLDHAMENAKESGETVEIL